MSTPGVGPQQWQGSPAQPQWQPAQPQQWQGQPQGQQQQQPQWQPQPVTAWQTLHLFTSKPSWTGYWPNIPLTVRIDGVGYRPPWGHSQFTIPADRPVHVSCSMAWLMEFGSDSYVVHPGQPAQLDYLAPAQQWVSGSLEPRGQAVVNGRGLQIGVFVVAGALVTGSVLTTILSVAAALS
jgi:hypothetical protein